MPTPGPQNRFASAGQRTPQDEIIFPLLHTCGHAKEGERRAHMDAAQEQKLMERLEKIYNQVHQPPQAAI
jgi:hypothetical protein